MGTKKSKEGQYVQKNLEILARNVFDIRNARDKGNTVFRVNINKLPEAIRALPKENREILEKFWGLTGGPNHSQKINVPRTDLAFINMRKAAEASTLMLYELDKVYLYDENLKFTVAKLAEKINKGGIQISDLDAVRYLIAFLVVLQNGPKMSFEEDFMTIDESISGKLTFDEYSVVYAAYKELKEIQDQSIDLRILKNWIEELDFNDSITIKKSFGIQLPDISHLKEAEKILQTIPSFKGKTVFPSNDMIKEIEKLQTLSQVREYKEKVFPFGSWEAASAFIFGKVEDVNLEEFFKKLSFISKDWSQIANFEIGKIQLKTSKGIREIVVYSIEGVEFTDPDEIRFIYLQGKNSILNCNV